MGRSVVGVLTVLFLTVSMVALAGGDPDKNQPGYWGEDCH